MISNEKIVNKKVVELIEVYNFSFGHIFIQYCLNNSKVGLYIIHYTSLTCHITFERCYICEHHSNVRDVTFVNNVH